MIDSDIERQLYELALADTDEFVKLAEISGLDPKVDFIGADLSGCDLSNQDLRIYVLHDANLTDCIFYKTLFSKENIRGAKFNTRKGYVVASIRLTEPLPSPSTESLNYTDAIATIIKEVVAASDPNQKLGILQHCLDSDDRKSIKKFAVHALQHDREMSGPPSVSIPYLMNLGVSLIYPLARGKLIDSYIRILGDDRNARSYLISYYDKRASGPNVRSALQNYIADKGSA